MISRQTGSHTVTRVGAGLDFFFFYCPCYGNCNRIFLLRRGTRERKGDEKGALVPFFYYMLLLFI